MPAAISLAFGSVSLDTHVKRWRESSARRIRSAKIPILDGLKAEIGRFDGRRIRIQAEAQGTSFTALRTTFDALLKELNNGKQFLTLFDDRRILCQRNKVDYDYVPGTPLSVVRFSLDFLAEAPFWESTTLTTTTEVINTDPESFNVVNNGSAFARPIITVTADQGGAVPNLTITNTTTGRKFSFTANIASTKALVIDTEAGTVLNDGVDAIGDFNGDLIAFLIEAGTNSIQYSGDVCTVKVEHRDRFA